MKYSRDFQIIQRKEKYYFICRLTCAQSVNKIYVVFDCNFWLQLFLPIFFTYHFFFEFLMFALKNFLLCFQFLPVPLLRYLIRKTTWFFLPDFKILSNFSIQQKQTKMEKQFGIMNKAQLQIQAIKQHLKRKRRSKRAQIKESFYCECGRVYLSFSALYLHAKIKHGTKLTTKQSSNVFTVEKVSGFAKFMYSMKAEKEKECIKECGESIQCQGVCDSKDYNGREEMNSLRKFLQESKELGSYLKILKSEEEKEMLTRFIGYALSMEKLSDSSVKQQINAIPLYLNAFLLDFLPKISEFSIESCQGKQVCQHLYKFCQWMQLNKLTDLLVVTNNGY